jgi:hypothetical protein
MNRQEATSLLREFLIECDGSLMASSVSLSSTGSENYQLNINCLLDDFLRKCINKIVERHQLKMREHDGKITISS